MGQTTATSLFRTIPPERVGLTGEYDHYGLAKRVTLAFNRMFETHEIGKLRVTQRGSVVVLMGNIDNQRLLIRLVQVAMGVSGAVDVEVNGVSVADCLKTYLDQPSKAVLINLLNLVKQT
ncbi:MAG TPA: phospholipid-binding protein [Coleofasciculaceae cyanobacterium]